jgi:hypothetical protein
VVLALVVLALVILAWNRRNQLLLFWNDLYASWTRISTFGKHLILVVSISIAIGLFGYSCGLYAKSRSTTWLCEYDPGTYPDCSQVMAASLTNPEVSPTPTPSAPTSTPTPTPSPNLTSQSLSPSSSPSPSPSATGSPSPLPTPIPLAGQQKDRLGEQAAKVKGLIRHHASVMAFFSQAYYSAICVLLFAGAILAAAVFFIGTKGWGQTNPYVRTIFVLMTVTVAFYGLWPPVFQQEKNLSDNKALFLEYETLQNEISSYPVTGTNVKNESKSPNDFINYVDSEMARLGNVAIGFDYTKISYKGAFESNSSSSPAPSPSPSSTKRPPG